MRNTVFFILASVFCTANLHAQVSGFKGSRFQLEANYSPNIGVRLIDDYSAVLNTDVSEHLLIGGENGLPPVALYESYGFSASYVFSRAGTLGIQYTQSQMIGSAAFLNGYIDDYQGISFPLDINSYLIKYDKYYALAPFKRYMRIGVGLDEIKTGDENDDDFEEDNKFLFFTLGMGTNSFITDHVYFNFGVDLNLSTAILKAENAEFGTVGSVPNIYKSLFNAKLLKLQLGLGINI